MTGIKQVTSNATHPPFPKQSIEQIETEIIPRLNQWALTNGLVMVNSDLTPADATVAPTTIYPTPIPLALYETAKSLQKDYNKLYAAVSKSDWLMRGGLEQAAKSDPSFTGKLFEMAKRCDSKQPLRMGLFRSDYLIDKNSNELKQVEFNTVAVSFAGLSTKVGELHAFLNNSGAYDSSGKLLPFYESMTELPVSESAVFMTRGIARGVSMYEPALGPDGKPGRKEQSLVVFMVEPNESNLYDQKLLEFNLLRLYGIQSIRLTLGEVLDELEYSKADDKKRLIHKKSGREVAVVYFRTGYDTKDYEYAEGSWEAREFLENSFAIKAPDLKLQLSGSKKIQQLLTQDEIISLFVDEAEAKGRLTKTFTKMYPLDSVSELGKKGRKIAMDPKLCKNYVLKPQREGGGHNVYKEDIPKYLSELDEKDWDSYVLMELIDAKHCTDNYIVKAGKLIKEPIVSELGIYGTILFNDDAIFFNEFAGSLLRSKVASSNEGGVVAGFGCIDSITIV